MVPIAGTGVRPRGTGEIYNCLANCMSIVLCVCVMVFADRGIGEGRKAA